MRSCWNPKLLDKPVQLPMKNINHKISTADFGQHHTSGQCQHNHCGQLYALQICSDLQDVWPGVHFLICQSDQRLSVLFRVCYLKNKMNEEQEICAGQTSVQEHIILSCNSVFRRKNEDAPGGTCDLRKDQIPQISMCTPSYFLSWDELSLD